MSKNISLSTGSTAKKGSLLNPLEKESPRIHKSKQHALDLSIKESVAAHAGAGFGGSQITPYALALGSSSFHIGLLSAVSGLCGPLAQLYGSKLMTQKSRKTIVLQFVFLQALIWLPIAALGYIFYNNILTEFIPYILIGLYFLLILFGSITAPAWFSWLGDLIPPEKRGKYFAKRNTIGGTVGIIAALSGAFLLDFMKTKGLVLTGFAVLFSLTFLFRIISLFIFKKEYSPHVKIKKSDNVSFKQFSKEHSDYKRYIIYRTLFHFAQMIVAPFFAVYMLQDLGFSYTTFMIVGLSSSFFYLLSTKATGRISDRYGNIGMIKFAMTLFSVTPLFWLFLKNPIHLILTSSLLNGIANAGLIIGATNLAYDALPQKQRGIGSAYVNIIFGFGTFFGSIIGGLLITYLNVSFIKPFFLVLIISVILRILVNISFIPQLKEERKVKRLPPIHVDLTHPFRTIQAEIGWIKHLLK